MSFTSLDFGSASYPSWATISEADKYNQVDNAVAMMWAALDDDGKKRNLVLATRRLNHFPYIGTKTDPDQETEFPRSGIPGFDSTKIPKPIEDATCYLAGLITTDPSHAHPTEVKDPNIKRVGAGEDIEVEYFHPGNINQDAKPIADATIYNLIRPFLRTSSTGSSRSRRGKARVAPDAFSYDLELGSLGV